MLASGAGGPEGVHFYIFFFYIDIDIFLHLRTDEDGGKRCVSSFARVKR